MVHITAYDNETEVMVVCLAIPGTNNDVPKWIKDIGFPSWMTKRNEFYFLILCSYLDEPIVITEELYPDIDVKVGPVYKYLDKEDDDSIRMTAIINEQVVPITIAPNLSRAAEDFQKAIDAERRRQGLPSKKVVGTEHDD